MWNKCLRPASIGEDQVSRMDVFYIYAMIKSIPIDMARIFLDYIEDFSCIGYKMKHFPYGAALTHLFIQTDVPLSGKMHVKKLCLGQKYFKQMQIVFIERDQYGTWNRVQVMGHPECDIHTPTNLHKETGVDAPLYSSAPPLSFLECLVEPKNGSRNCGISW